MWVLENLIFLILHGKMNKRFYELHVQCPNSSLMEPRFELNKLRYFKIIILFLQVQYCAHCEQLNTDGLNFGFHQVLKKETTFTLWKPHMRPYSLQVAKLLEMPISRAPSGSWSSVDCVVNYCGECGWMLIMGSVQDSAKVAKKRRKPTMLFVVDALIHLLLCWNLWIHKNNPNLFWGRVLFSLFTKIILYH